MAYLIDLVNGPLDWGPLEELRLATSEKVRQIRNASVYLVYIWTCLCKSWVILIISLQETYGALVVRQVAILVYCLFEEVATSSGSCDIVDKFEMVTGLAAGDEA